MEWNRLLEGLQISAIGIMVVLVFLALTIGLTVLLGRWAGVAPQTMADTVGADSSARDPDAEEAGRIAAAVAAVHHRSFRGICTYEIGARIPIGAQFRRRLRDSLAATCASQQVEAEQSSRPRSRRQFRLQPVGDRDE